MNASKKGILIVLSGPAGTGKGSVVQEILKRESDFALSVSATTRAPRPGEVDGVHYHFLTKEAFETKIQQSEMLEHAYYCGNYYGTPKENVENMLNKGISVILEIEVQGALNIRRICPDSVLILLLPPDYQTLEARLRGRKTNTEEDIQNRLKQARTELQNFSSYDYVVINQNQQIDRAAQEVISIVRAEQSRTGRNKHIPDSFFHS
jgi:guanylate kinase